MLETALLQSLFPLIAICAALGISLLLLKKYALKRRKNKTAGLEISVLSRISLHPKTNVFIVKAGEKTLLLGATDHNINTLADLTEPKPQASNFKSLPVSTTEKPNFQKVLKSQQSKQINNNLSFKAFLRSTIAKS